MPSNIFSSGRWTRKGAVALIVLLGLLFTATAAYASLYVISTGDSSVDEWDAAGQNIPIFQTSPISATLNSSLDIIEVKVASGSTTSPATANMLFFRMKLNASPALNLSNHAALAMIDCDGNGSVNDAVDRTISYNPSKDGVTMMFGNESQYLPLGNTYGQRVGEYVEWSVPIDQLPPDSDTDPTNCRDNIQIRFATADISSYFPPPGRAVILDHTDPVKGWNVPTAVRLESLSVASTSKLKAPVIFAASGMVILMGFAGIVFIRRRRH